MGRISEPSDEERDTLFGRRLVKSFTGNREQTFDFWDREVEAEDLEALDQHFPDEERGVRGFRRKPVYLDGRDDWN